MLISDLNNTDYSISSTVWRYYCLGKTGGSESTWTSYRSLVGIKKRFVITPRQAFLLLVRSKIDDLYKNLGRVKPKSNFINILSLEKLASDWLNHHSSDGWYNLLSILSDKAELETDLAKSRYEEFTGLKISIRTFRRRCDAVGFKLSIDKGISTEQLQSLTGHAIKKGLVAKEWNV